jgi:hypothetical protein
MASFLPAMNFADEFLSRITQGALHLFLRFLGKYNFGHNSKESHCTTYILLILT